MNQKIIFSDIKSRLLSELNKKLKEGEMPIQEPLDLIDGFVNQTIQNELSSSLIVGWPSIPMIAAGWKNSGMIYYFALFAILPDLRQETKNEWETE